MVEIVSELNQSDVVIRKADGAVVAAIPQFGLFARADTVQAALDALEEKKLRLGDEFEAFAGLREPLAGARSVRLDWSDVAQFAVKAGVVFVLLGALIFYAGIKMQEAANQVVYGFQGEVRRVVTVNIGKALLEKLEHELDRAASPAADLPPDRKQKVLANIRTLADRWRPAVAEASRLFATNEPAGAPPPAR